MFILSYSLEGILGIPGFGLLWVRLLWTEKLQLLCLFIRFLGLQLKNLDLFGCQFSEGILKGQKPLGSDEIIQNDDDIYVCIYVVVAIK